MHTPENDYRDDTKGVTAIVFGIIFIIVGIISMLYGNSENNSYERQFESFFSSGTRNPGSTFVILGIIGIVLGIILLVVGIWLNSKNNSTPISPNNSMVQTEFYNPIDDRIKNLMDLKNKNLISDDEFINKYHELVREKQNGTCPTCGTKVESRGFFCSICGHKLREVKNEYRN